MPLSRLVRRANHVDFACDTFKNPSINDITREDKVWYMERSMYLNLNRAY